MDRSLSIHHDETLEKNPDLSLPDPNQSVYAKTTFGFWTYLMTDCLLFATLFCTYAVMHNSTFGGPTSKDLFRLSDAFIETMLLLFSSVTSGLALLASLKGKTKQVVMWLGITFLLGAGFLFIELTEFRHFYLEGHSWTKSAFLSAFFTLLGTHGLHVAVGLLWIIVLSAQLLYQGINTDTFRRLAIFGMFWHFIDLVWIFIFTFVYLMGVI